MKKIIGIAGVILCVLLVLKTAVDQDVLPVECSSSDIQSDAGFSKFIKEIEPIDDVGCEEELKQRTESKIEANKQITEQLEEINRMQEDIDLLAHLVRCEAGNQPLAGKRAVVAVVLNRVDSKYFPNNIHDVIYQTGQFTCLVDGNWEKYARYIDETDYKAVELELAERTNTEIVYFSSQNCANGELVFVIGDHYFAKR